MSPGSTTFGTSTRPPAASTRATATSSDGPALRYTSEPSSDGAGPSLDVAVARVEAAGGRVLVPKVVLPGDMGCFVQIADTEGNRVGLHALR